MNEYTVGFLYVSQNLLTKKHEKIININLLLPTSILNSKVPGHWGYFTFYSDITCRLTNA